MMFFSPEQQRLIALLQEFGCMRNAQAACVLHSEYGTRSEAMPHIIRQLRTRGQLREHDGVITGIGRSARPELLNAIDVALALFGGMPQVAVDRPPFLLCAYASEKDLQLQLLYVPVGMEDKKSFTADNIPEPNVPTVLVLLLDHPTQKENLLLTRPCMLAYRDNTHKLHFEQINGGTENG